MTGTSLCGLLVTVLLLLDECLAIPLPGVQSHLQQSTDSSLFANPYAVFQNENKFEPTFRDVVPKFNNTTLQQQVPFAATETNVKPTENPLETLLDKLYGSNKWRNLLNQTSDSSTIPTTQLPLLARATESAKTSFQGFYGNEISGNRFNSLPINQRTTTTHKPRPVMNLNNLNNSGNSKFMLKIVGTRQHVSTKSPNLNFNTNGSNGSKFPKLTGPFSKDQGTSSIFLKEQDRGSQTPITMRQPVMSVTQKPQMGVDGVARYDPNRVNTVGGNQPQYFTNSELNNFNPNQVNNEQTLFRPNSAFNADITQTGSDPNNHKLPVAYDADAINERYMVNVNSLYHGQTGQATETVYGKEQYGYRFSAYGDAKPQLFDANALNQAMLKSNGNMQQQQMSPMFPPGARVQQPTAQSYRPIPQGSGEKEATAIHKNYNGHLLNPTSVLLYTTSPKPPLNFGFVPGNLFPGQSFQTADIKQEAAPQAFLRHVQISTGNDAFNPTLINAAQNAYNPNEVTWVQSRDIEDVGGHHVGEMDDVIVNATATMAITLSTYIPRTTLSTRINSTVESSSKEKGSINKTDVSISAGFDPNIVNYNQGQIDFIPGQIAPAFSGYMSNTYKQGQGLSYGSFQNEFNPNNKGQQGGPQMTFNIAQLLGFNTGATGNDTNAGYGQGTSSFNPNIVNNIMKADVGGSASNSGFDPNVANQGFASILGSNFGGNVDNSTTHTAGFSIGSFSTGFDPNAASHGFANILGSDGYGFSQGNTSSNQSTVNMNSYGGFDPNSANVGFGESGFSMGSSGTSGGSGYMSAFDPNKVNQIAIQNPFDQGANLTENGDMSAYLLGIVPGNDVGKHNAHSSAYMSAFNPDSVNVAPYDPNKYNQVHVHFDPLDMISKNPGIDKDTLVAAASAFDADKLNSANIQQAFSPIAMLSGNPGKDSNVLSNTKFDPYAASSTNTNSSTSSAGVMQLGRQNSANSSQTQAGFDPIALMTKLMQSSGAFMSGIGETGKLSFNPSSVFESKNDANTQSPSSTITPTSVSPTVKYVTTNTTQAYSQLTVPLTLPTVPSLSSTSVAATTTHSSNGTIG